MSLMTKLGIKIFGDPNLKQIKKLDPIIAKINELEPSFEPLSDSELQEKTQEFRERLNKDETLDDILPEAFALVREASKRVLKMRHFDVQLVGGIILHQGKIAEMKTGEGKTLVSTLPSYLNALEGKGVYVVTVNDYLARRDSEWMGQVFRFLGLTVGLIQHNMSPEERIKAYRCDITYGTNNEFGFDYLRDNLAGSYQDLCQIRRHFAVIDEVDSILIDEARTPLIISGPVQISTEKYVRISKIVKKLEKETHFTLDEKHKNVVLTEPGIEEIEKILNLDSIYSLENMDIAHMAVQCLRALYLYNKDVDYVVKDGEILIVDEFTGRILDGRRYSDGLHQAIEANEGVRIKEESQTLASITFQNYFRMFPKLSGMTGTAATEAEEFVNIYSLDVVVIPTNKPLQRIDNSDVVYKSKDEKYKAIAKDVKNYHQEGQPVLVGTISIEISELLSKYLTKMGIPHKVLNAKYHEQEAEIISNAGQRGAVTIATNMAGRGTDIVLGEGVQDLGGLCVLGSERHESRRIDNQLRGRSGRQGDPGFSRFYVALDDDLMRLFGSDRIARVMDTLGVPSDTPIEHKLISRSIEKAQAKVEKYHFGVRKQILQYDDVMNKQRLSFYSIRTQFLKGENIDANIKKYIEELVDFIYDEFIIDQKLNEGENAREFATRLEVIFPVDNLYQDLPYGEAKSAVIAELKNRFYALYQSRKSHFPESLFEEIVVKRTMLITLDRKWMDHLHNMDVLREGIGLRAYGQRDPLLEYKMEAFDMFKFMLISVYEEAFEIINKAEIVRENVAEQLEQSAPIQNLTYGRKPVSSQPETKSQSTAVADKVGRNDDCPCGSGKKYKKCCMN